MNKETVKGRWNEFVATMKVKYAEIKDDKELETKANIEKFAAHLQAKYGIAKEEAEKQAKEFGKAFK
ncbi:CsbD family protein [Pseudofrancisella aestuarii]|uniref:CsbD family protein n=1 Tax=Pseudofrancisella aestuarii TaxID=2670347 RepID=A0ABV9TAB5_9GAMM|nr:CsbD family protein [Pseudofrancisella aestuarii]